MAVSPVPAPTILTNPAREFPDWIEAYMRFTDNTEAPESFHLWTAISTIGGALSRKCSVKIGRFELQPSFYITFVAPPGIATKSTTAKQGMDLLSKINAIRMFRGSISWQALIDELMDGLGQVDLGQGRLLEMSSLQLFASELGVLIGGDHDGQMLDLLVDLWDGIPQFQRRTRTGGEINIPRPFINLIACTTPGWLTKNAGKYAVDGGFFSRTVFVYAEKKRKVIAYPEAFDQGAHEKLLLKDLDRISKMKGIFTLDEEALEWGTAWYEELHTVPPPHLASEMFQSYISRRQAHLHKVAMVVSASKRSDMIITLEDMVIAEDLLMKAEIDLKLIYQAIVTSDKVQAYTLIIKYMRGATKGVPKNTLFRMMSSSVSYNEFEAGMQAAVFARQIKVKDMKDGFYVFPSDVL